MTESRPLHHVSPGAKQAACGLKIPAEVRTRLALSLEVIARTSDAVTCAPCRVARALDLDGYASVEDLLERRG